MNEVSMHTHIYSSMCIQRYGMNYVASLRIWTRHSMCVRPCSPSNHVLEICQSCGLALHVCIFEVYTSGVPEMKGCYESRDDEEREREKIVYAHTLVYSCNSQYYLGTKIVAWTPFIDYQQLSSSWLILVNHTCVWGCKFEVNKKLYYRCSVSGSPIGPTISK